MKLRKKPTARRRFRFERLEERIAPKRICDLNPRYNPHGKRIGCGKPHANA
ncbi:MAG: hypothetical protein ACYTDU_13815 [Planctomycetota bacterium]|jgi:hypothetical protein